MKTLTPHQQPFWPEQATHEPAISLTVTWNIRGTGAAFSLCHAWRYALWRVWDVDKPLMLVVGLNPSTADEATNDATVTRCMARAMAHDAGGLLVGNLFAYRSTDPKALRTAPDPLGPDNDAWLSRLADSAGTIICAWGAHGAYRNRDLHVRRRLDNVGERLLWCWGTTKDGQPRHPLYLPYTTPLIPY